MGDEGGGSGRGHQLLAEREWDGVSPHVRCPWALWVAGKGSLVGESSSPVCGPGEGRRVAARTLAPGPCGERERGQWWAGVPIQFAPDPTGIVS